jgi:hypothetical protein
MMCAMPSIPHEAPLELLRASPRLAVVLLRSLGIPVPDGATARPAPTDLSTTVPAELRADAVVQFGLYGVLRRSAAGIEVSARSSVVSLSSSARSVASRRAASGSASRACFSGRSTTTEAATT